MMNPATFYTNRIATLRQHLNKLERKNSLLGWARFLSLVGSVPAVYALWPLGAFYTIPASVLLVAVFIRIVYADIDNKDAIRHQEQLLYINELEAAAQDGKYYGFANGSEYQPHDHHYANDLDILGHASLFQYINRTTSAMGGAALAQWLLSPAARDIILQRQQASKELHGLTEWRQALQAYGNEKPIRQHTYNRLQEWIAQPYSFINHRYWLVMRVLVPVIMCTVIGLNIAEIISDPARNLVLLSSAILAFFISRKVVPLHAQVSKMTAELEVLSDCIRLIEQQPFASPLLQQLQQAYVQQQSTASAQMKQLKGIVQRMDWRLNPVVFIPLAIVFQWDLQQVIALENWKQRNHQRLLQWFEALGQFEAINSLGTLHFNHPQWCFPTLLPDHFSIEGTHIGHPLINVQKRVNNPIHIARKGTVMLVTGSNMAGKSTYLRSIGINTVLTMTGAAVCADTFSISPVQLISSMRIADNLEENTSTFYAELKKLKTVIELANQHAEVFILLDEILRGTNSLDRHTGAVALTKQLIREEAAAIIATHDVELANIVTDYPANILNFHFDAQVQQEELYFDYRLKTGICTSINASLLMKKIGIEI